MVIPKINIQLVSPLGEIMVIKGGRRGESKMVENGERQEQRSLQER